VRETDEGVMIPEYTTWTAASDLKNVRTFADQTIRSDDLKAALTAAGGNIRIIPMAPSSRSRTSRRTSSDRDAGRLPEFHLAGCADFACHLADNAARGISFPRR
jgi:hypothetical protein